MSAPAHLDQIDREIINNLQGGFPLAEYPFREAADKLGIDENELINRVDTMLASGVLSRFGPMINAEKMGGGLTLAALSVPEDDFSRIAGLVNAHTEVAHNYRREHHYNMWFVVATSDEADISRVIGLIEEETGLAVLNVPKLEEFFIGLKIDA